MPRLEIFIAGSGWVELPAGVGFVGGVLKLLDLSDVSAKTGTGSTVVMDTSPTLITPVLALPTISGSAFVNAQHTHQAASAGGKLDHGAALNGLGDDDHTQYLLADGARNMGGNFFLVDTFGFVIGHTSKIDFGATPEFQVLGTNTSDASMGFARFEDNTSGPDVRFLKSRAAAIGDNVIVQDGDTLGRIRFQGDDGGDFNTTAAEIMGQVDGTPGLNDIPGRIIFKTRIDGGALTEKMRLDNQGRLGIGTTPATSALLDLASTTGAILIPRMTTTQRDALTAVNAMMIYNSTLNKFQSYENSDWVTMIGGGGGAMQSITITPQMRSGGTSTPSLEGTTVGEEHRSWLMAINDTWITELWLPSSYGGAGTTTLILGTMASGVVTNDVKFELSWERIGITQDIHGASSFATAQNGGDVTVPVTTALPFEYTVTHASGAEMDSTTVSQRFRLELKRVTVAGTDASGDYEFLGMLLDEQ